MPNVTLMKDGQDLSKDKNVSIDITDRAITLTIRNPDKNTSGPYNIKLDNNLGSDEATLRIHVSDVPGVPTNVKAEPISEDTIKLNWRAPEDDGGSLITNYIIEKLDPDTGKWAKVGTSRFAHAMLENLQPNKPYQFRVTAENVFGPGPVSEPSNVVQTSGCSRLIFSSS